jgi:adenosylhomocysteine nucleosidase
VLKTQPPSTSRREIAPTRTCLFVTALEMEAQAVISVLRRPSVKDRAGHIQEGRLTSNWRGVVVVSGMGADRARDRLEEMLLQTKPNLVFVAGLAGGLDPSLATGAVVQPYRIWRRSKSEKDHPKVTVARMKIPSVTQVDSLLTTDEIVDTVDAKRILRTTYGASAVDMETWAIAQACQAASIPCTVLRAISDDAHTTAPPELMRCADHFGRVKPIRSMITFAANPTLLKQANQFRKGAQAALQSLKVALAAVDWSQIQV